MPATKEKTSSKEKLLEAAEALMLAKGYEATSADEICEKAKVSRGSFFYYFKSKEDLGKELIDRFSEKTGKAMCCSPAMQSDEPLEKLFGFLDGCIQITKDPKMKGCLVGTFAQELYESHPELRKCCGEKFSQTIDMVHTMLRDVKKKYAPKANIDTKALAELWLSTGQGSMLVARATKDRSVVARALTQYKNYISKLFEQ